VARYQLKGSPKRKGAITTPVIRSSKEKIIRKRGKKIAQQNTNELQLPSYSG
jgi:hypothetical protein